MTALVAGLKKLEVNPGWLRSAWGISLLVVILVAVFDRHGLVERLVFAATALLQTAPYVLFAVVCIGWLKASAAEGVVARAFQGRESRMIVLAALVGGLTPFCSCEVIPFVAALLAAGTPLSAVMAFWLASPLMDPPAFAITAGALGWEFAVGKTAAAVGIGLFGGFFMKLLMSRGAFASPLRARSGCGSCCGSEQPLEVKGWFWPESDRRKVFWSAATENTLFLLKWLLLAYLLEAAMVAYLPASAIAGVVGGEGVASTIVGALVGTPAYLNAYAAPALVSGLIEQGMSISAGMAFMVAGGMTSIPAMAAVFALVKRDVFLMYIGFAFTGAVAAGLVFQALVVRISLI